MVRWINADPTTPSVATGEEELGERRGKERGTNKSSPNLGGVGKRDIPMESPASEKGGHQKSRRGRQAPIRGLNKTLTVG